MASATHKLAQTARTTASAKQAAAKKKYGAGSKEHKAAIKNVKAAESVMKAEKKAEGLSHDEAREEREELVKEAAGLSGQKLFDKQTEIRAYGNVMRDITGRQKGEGTSYIGPGLRVAIEEDGKTIQRDDQGRVVYDVDPEAYEKRFIPKFTPTQEQIELGKELFPDYGITEGYLTPWQQVNVQWMTGSKSDQLGLLDDMGIEATDENLALFTDNLKEGIVPK